MLKKVCDRCGKDIIAVKVLYEFNSITGYLPNHTLDICSECQQDFDRWLNELREAPNGTD